MHYGENYSALINKTIFIADSSPVILVEAFHSVVNHQLVVDERIKKDYQGLSRTHIDKKFTRRGEDINPIMDLVEITQ